MLVPIRRIFALGGLLLLAAGAVAIQHRHVRRSSTFIQHWSGRFRSVNHLETARRIATSEPVIVRTFSSGEWFIATCEHSCCSGAGFDATVIRDSTGAIYASTTHPFCGIEGLGEELGERKTPATSLQAFHAALAMSKLRKP